MKTNGRANVGNRIGRDLDAALSRLRQLGAAVMVMDLPGTIGGNSAFADELDQIQVSASRDIGLATRELLQERVNRLSAALDRLNEGAYGVCVECAEPIAPARLEAVPEVETCVRCQDGLVAACSRPAKTKRRMKRFRRRIARRSFRTRRIAVRLDEAFVIGALTGATVVWLWGRTIEDRIAAQARAVRTMAADGIQAVEVTVRPAPATREA